MILIFQETNVKSLGVRLCAVKKQKDTKVERQVQVDRILYNLLYDLQFEYTS